MFTSNRREASFPFGLFRNNVYYILKFLNTLIRNKGKVWEGRWSSSAWHGTTHTHCCASASLSWQGNVGFLTGHHCSYMLWGNNNNLLAPAPVPGLAHNEMAQGEQPQVRWPPCLSGIGHHNSQIWVLGRKNREDPSVTEGKNSQEWRIPNTFYILPPLQRLWALGSTGSYLTGESWSWNKTRLLNSPKFLDLGRNNETTAVERCPPGFASAVLLGSVGMS